MQLAFLLLLGGTNLASPSKSAIYNFSGCAVICKSPVHAVDRSLFDTLPHVCSAKVQVEGNFQYFRYILIDFVDECLK